MYAEYKAAGLGINWRLAAMLPNVVVIVYVPAIDQCR